MYAKPNALVETDWLADHLDDTQVAIVEVDEDTEAFASGHIPGAVSLNWRDELQAGPRRDFVDGETMAGLFASKGISDDQLIVIYGGNNNWFAAYAYWLCLARGIENVALLNGGRIKWEAEGRPMTQESEAVTAGRFAAGSARPELRVFRDDVIRTLSNATRLVDVRSPAEFSGEVKAPPHLPEEQPYVAGHIPGAVNVPWSQAVRDDGTFKTFEDLKALYESVGVDGSSPVIAYCRIGERSSHTWFVLNELLGFENVANYDGSWTEYGSLVDVPVGIGATN